MIKIGTNTYDPYLGSTKMAKVIYVDGDNVQHTIWPDTPPSGETYVFYGTILEKTFKEGLTEQIIKTNLSKVTTASLEAGGDITFTVPKCTFLRDDAKEFDEYYITWTNENIYTSLLIFPQNMSYKLTEQGLSNKDYYLFSSITLDNVIYNIYYLNYFKNDPSSYLFYDPIEAYEESEEKYDNVWWAYEDKKEIKTFEYEIMPV